MTNLTALGLSGPTVFFGLTIFMGLGNGICLPNANAGMMSVRPELAGTASGAAKMLQPADVARAVVHTIERPRFEVPLPGYVSLLARLVDLLPQAVRDAALRRLVPNQVTATRGSSERRQYESHTVTGTEGQQ